VLSAENLAGIESEGRRLLITARREPDRPVPQYPEWTLTDLAVHTASMHARTTEVLRELPRERIPAPSPPDGGDPLEWCEGALDDMLNALTEVDSTLECWGFGPEPIVGFWETRMVVETGVHRWDAYRAFGEEDRLTDLVARTGLEEFSGMWLPRLPDLPGLEIRATDLQQDWKLGVEPRAAITGSASDLFLRLMSRPSPVELPVEWAAAVDELAPPRRP